MIERAGVIWGVRDGSYVYAIVQANCIYFGETGALPPKRWGQHLQTDGTFTCKMRDADVTLEDEMVFIGVRCSEIDKVSPDRRKLARRAVEEELHLQFFLDSYAFGRQLSIVSQAPEPPVRIAWPFDPAALAKAVYALVVNEFGQWMNRQLKGGA